MRGSCSESSRAARPPTAAQRPPRAARICEHGRDARQAVGALSRGRRRGPRSRGPRRTTQSALAVAGLEGEIAEPVGRGAHAAAVAGRTPDLARALPVGPSGLDIPGVHRDAREIAQPSAGRARARRAPGTARGSPRRAPGAREVAAPVGDVAESVQRPGRPAVVPGLAGQRERPLVERLGARADRRARPSAARRSPARRRARRPARRCGASSSSDSQRNPSRWRSRAPTAARAPRRA